MKKTFAYALLILTALYSCEEGKQEEPKSEAKRS